MSVNCLDTDALVSVGAALDWDVPGRLDHLAACERCRAGLADLADLRGKLTGIAAVPGIDPAALTGHALAGLTTGRTPAAQGGAVPAPAGAASRRTDRVAAVATFLVAGATVALLVLLLAGKGSAPVALAFAAIAGTASVLPLRLPFRRQRA